MRLVKPALLFLPAALMLSVYLITAPREEVLAQPVRVWGHHLGTSAIDGATACATDAQGNLFIAGGTRGDLFAANSGDFDAFAAKYDGSGNRVWGVQFGSDKSETVNGLAIDGEGALYLVGTTAGALPNCTSGGEEDGFVARISPGGTLLWVRQLGSSKGEDILGVAVRSNGNALVAGSTDGRLFGEGSDPESCDYFIAEYDSNGQRRWERQYPCGNSEVCAFAIATDSQNHIYIAGECTGLFDESRTLPDAFVAKHDSSGVLLWGRQFGSDAIDSANSIRVAECGAVYVGGCMNANSGPDADSPSDGFVARYDSDGNQVWLTTVGTTTEDSITYILPDSRQSVLACGDTLGDLFDTKVGQKEDAFVVRLDSQGNILWGGQFGSDKCDSANSLAVGAGGDVIVCGNTEGDLCSPVSGECDAFLIRLAAVAEPVAVPGPGTYASGQSITITCATDGATIRYTTDGSEPTESSPEYTVPVTVDHTLTLKARAWKTGYIPSYVRSAQYTIQ